MNEEIRIYVADLAAYNNSKLHGVWINACDDLDEIQEQIHTMLKNSPEGFAEEYAIHDQEGFGSISTSEYEGLESIHEKALFIEEHGELGAAVLAHWYEDMEEVNKAFEESYHGEHESLADFAQQLTEETSEVPKHLAFYIDYEKMARDMEMNGDVYTIETGYQAVHVFWGQ